MSVTASTHPKLLNATDDFIGEILPGWLKLATPDQLKTLRACFEAHHDSQQVLRKTLGQLKAPAAYGKALLAPALQTLTGQTLDLDKAQWRERGLGFDAALNRAEFKNSYAPALQRLLQNFKQGQSFYDGTALVYPADPATQAPEQVLTTQMDGLVTLCRTLDVGGNYQKHLDEVFDGPFMTVLAKDLRLQLALATQIASLKGQLTADDLRMLSRVTQQQAISHSKSVSVRCGEVKVLDARVDGALAFELRGSWEYNGQGATLPIKPLKGVILYLPMDREKPLQHYTNWGEANLALGEKVRDAAYRQALEQRIALADRAAYLTTLGKRLSDPNTDMQASFSEVTAELFDTVAGRHLQRIRNDAQFLVVPTAMVDAAVSSARAKALQTAGLVLLGLAGLFVPGVGAVLLADMIRQTLQEVYAGIDDWSQGHRHEALEHLLGVAQTLAIAGATVGVARFVRSTFVEGLVPVQTQDGRQRLWSDDLACFARSAPAEGLVELDNGLLSDGHDHWWRDAEGRYYRVRPSDGRSTWQLVHPTDASAPAPQLESNGERAWRLTSEHPLEWAGERALLARLWPPAGRLDEPRVGDILRVADVDQAQLRGWLVEARPMPVALRDTLERFAVDARLQAFFDQVDEGQASDAELLAWCVEKQDLAGEPFAEQLAAIREDAPHLRAQMLEHFSRGYLRQDAQLALLQRDFPGLPDAYALRLLEQVTADQRERMIAESRIPLAVAEQARALLRVAQLTRMREGLYLRGSYSELTTELVFALLRRRVGVQSSLSLVLREGSDVGPTLARLYPESGAGQITTIMVRRDGRLRLYDQDGRDADIEVAEPCGLPEVLLAWLPQADLQRLGWQGADASERVLADLRAWLPADSLALSRLVGLRQQRPWFVPLQRLEDGRPGYPLSGRRSGRTMSHTILRNRVRALYPGFNDRQVDTFVDILLEQPGSAYANLQVHERAFRQLDEVLNRWVTAEQAIPRQDLRRLVARELLRSWRLEGEPVVAEPGDPEGRRLGLIGIPVGSLPELPAGADFSHVTDLTLVGLRLERLPSGFLRSFPQLRRLILSNNRLRAIPDDIGRLTHLRMVNLARNQIRLTTGGAQVLRNLATMRHLDLSNNPLGTVRLNFNQMSRLREINLQRTGLQAIPPGLEWCGFLDYADLRHNQIMSVPQALLNAPFEIRQALDLTGNPLSVATRLRLRAPLSLPLRGASALVQPVASRTLWLQTLETDQQGLRGEQWDTLRNERGGEGFFELLQELSETSDYRRARADLGRRVWEVIESAVQDGALREELFNLAGSQRTCVDSVASCFSTLEVRAMVASTLRELDPEQAVVARLNLARRLFRLDQVERIARADITQRNAEGIGVDEIEVSLAYRTRLATVLDLPGQPRTMQFEGIAEVNQEQLDSAAREVRTREAGDGLAEYISQRDFWLAYLRGEYAERFTAAEQPFWDQLDALEQQRQPESQYLAAMNQLARDREKALQQLALQLTREALAAQGSGGH
ncbi:MULTISPECIES: NEL-type E3 ubiquitin ligase domain-containing protein [Pseudomonas]|uniref:NEL-type E3 ubiquitin ligase domain-containing protein n=1 Tax=Pseudomonas TaxID=286 RepID=UPI001E3AFD6D|nr:MULTISPECIES: NEL-type E3 ubiquitin ligase domain-containing protein [Pseudomonas]MCE1117086.1 hypothetical protein [Pseudomonas sp. NMI795_08]